MQFYGRFRCNKIMSAPITIIVIIIATTEGRKYCSTIDAVGGCVGVAVG